MRVGYNTNGFAHHRLEDAIAILAGIGYRSIAITLDHHALDPYSPELPDQRRRVRALLDKHGLHCVIETGSRFLLNPRVKHAPTLLDHSPEDRDRRGEFLGRAIDLAHYLSADAVSFWSGARPPDLSDDQVMERLVQGCQSLAVLAQRRGVRLAFEPEPGMFVDTMARFAELHARVDHRLFGLTLDAGHVHCLGDGRIGEHLITWRECLFNLHLEDMRRGVHEHLMFGDGEMDIAAIMADLRKIDYQFGVHVELPRHSHKAVETARKSFELLGELTRG